MLFSMLFTRSANPCTAVFCRLPPRQISSLAALKMIARLPKNHQSQFGCATRLPLEIFSEVAENRLRFAVFYAAAGIFRQSNAHNGTAAFCSFVAHAPPLASTQPEEGP